MTVDCDWIEKNLEAFFCERLNEDEARLARTHIEYCLACRSELQALYAIDPLIKKYFRRELSIAQRPRTINKGRVFGLGSAAVAVAAVMLLVIRTPQQPPLMAPADAEQVKTSTASVEAPPPLKVNEPAAVTRLKPSPEPDPSPDRKPQTTLPVTADSPDFLVTDPAGYSHTLDEYRGRVVVIGVWGRQDPETIERFEQLYKANATNSKLRFLGVSSQRDGRPPNTTFPLFYNEGSKLFGAQDGAFVLLDEKGDAELRGSLVNDFESLAKALRAK